jgi:hypothetical protein
MVRFGGGLVGKPLLALNANGERYFIARVDPPGELWFLSEEAGGIGSGGPLMDGSGASAAPFEHFVFAGRLPAGARTAEIEANGAVIAARSRSGLWLAAVPWGGYELRGAIRYLDGGGAVVAETNLYQPAA